MQPWAVCSQHTNNARLVSKGRHRARTKGSWNTLLEQRDFLEGLGPEREAGGFYADWTFRRCHLLQLRSDYLLGGGGTCEKCTNPSPEVRGPSCDPVWVYATETLPSVDH